MRSLYFVTFVLNVKVEYDMVLIVAVCTKSGWRRMELAALIDARWGSHIGEF